MVGIFDSGIGGLTVVKEIFKQLPGQPIIYFGDTARTPYGNKSQETISRYSIENTNFLLSVGATIIVIGCNTASAMAYDALRERFSEVPIFEVISPAVEAAISATKNKRIGVIGTAGTVNSGIYERKIHELDPEIKVFHEPCPLFVPLVEEGWIDRPETKMIARKYLSKLKQNQIDTLILGCTHYPLLKKVIQAKIGNRARLIDPAEATAKKLADFVVKRGIKFTAGADGSRFYLSDLTPKFSVIAEKWLGRKISFVIPTERRNLWS